MFFNYCSNQDSVLTADSAVTDQKEEDKDKAYHPIHVHRIR